MLTMLMAAVANAPTTIEWNPTIAVVMGVFNLLGIILARNVVEVKGVGPASPLPIPGLSGKDFSLAQLIAGMSFGHILGTGAILGLSNSGLL